MDCSANATPEFEGRGGNELATEISRTLSRAYRDPQVFDLKSLCLLPGRQVYILRDLAPSLKAILSKVYINKI